MLNKLLSEALKTESMLSEINNILKEKCDEMKLELGYYPLKSELKILKMDISEWLTKNEKYLNYTFIADTVFLAEDYLTSVFDYNDTEFEFDIPSKNSCDITIYIHLINDRIVIFKEVSKYDNYDNRWEIMGLYKAELG